MIRFRGHILQPQACVVREEACGQYEMEMVHPLDERVEGVSFGEVISVPVPARESPAIRFHHAVDPAHTIWRTTESTPLRVSPEAGMWEIVQLHAGTEYEKLQDVDAQWHEAVTREGHVGYLLTAQAEYVRTEPAGSSSIVQPMRTRHQFFRIYSHEIDTAQGVVTLRGRHVSYDAASYIAHLTSYFEQTPVADILSYLQSHVYGWNSIRLRTECTDVITADYRGKNLLECILDPENGMAYRIQAEVVRENLDIFVLNKVGIDRGVVIAHGKNLLGVKYVVDDSARIKRIIPVGRNLTGEPVYLPEGYIDTANQPGHPWTSYLLEVKGALFDGSDPQPVYERMRQAAADEYSRGADLPSVQMDVDFVALGDTQEYQQYRELERLHLFDTVHIEDDMHGIRAAAQVAAYEWNCLTERYLRITLGDVHAVERGGIAGYELPTGGIPGYKLVRESVGTSELANGSFTRVKASSAFLQSLQADAVDATTARIRQLIADDLTADELYAGLATIATAQMTTANIEQADILWGNIENLKSAMVDAFRARIQYLIANDLVTDELYAALAEIATAEIGTANIDWAKIKDLVSGRQIFEQGAGGKLYIADLAVTEANMVSLTVGELIVRGTDGRFYAVSVDVEGNVITELKQVANGDIEDEGIDGGAKIIEGSVTADRLNAMDIFADNAIIRQLMAANLDVDTLFARQGTIDQLRSMDLVAINNSIRVTVENLENKVTQLTAGVDGLNSSKVQTDQYIQFGLLYVDDQDVPRVGVGIGEKLTRITDGAGNVVLERSGLAQTITSDRQSFWQNGEERTWVSNNKMYSQHIHAVQSLALNDWIWTADSGLTLAWAGE